MLISHWILWAPSPLFTSGWCYSLKATLNGTFLQESNGQNENKQSVRHRLWLLGQKNETRHSSLENIYIYMISMCIYIYIHNNVYLYGDLLKPSWTSETLGLLLKSFHQQSALGQACFCSLLLPHPSGDPRSTETTGPKILKQRWGCVPRLRQCHYSTHFKSSRSMCSPKSGRHPLSDLAMYIQPVSLLPF